jgi:hypothetical protein
VISPAYSILPHFSVARIADVLKKRTVLTGYVKYARR